MFYFLRCFYVGQTYASQKKWKEAVALYERVNTYIQDAERHMKSAKDEESKVRPALMLCCCKKGNVEICSFQCPCYLLKGYLLMYCEFQIGC